MRYLVNGSIAYDVLLNTDTSFVDVIDPKAINKLSISMLAQKFARHHGGTGANIAWNLMLLRQEATMIGAVGSDGGPYLELLKERGIDTQFVEKLDKFVTATAIIGTDSGERQIAFFHPGADAHGKLPAVADEREETAFAIVSPRDAMAMLQSAKDFAAAGIPFLFDPGQQSHAFGKDEFRAAVKGSKGLIVNDYEWTLASAKLEWTEQEVVEACGLLVITRGEHGLTLQDKKERVSVKACKIEKMMNPTGAGDALRAGLLVGLGALWPLKQCGMLGAAMGALVVQLEGTMMDNLDIDELQEMITENYGEEVPAFA